MNLFIALLLICMTAKAQTGQQYPRLFFKYSWLFENICSPLSPPPRIWRQEAIAKEQKFQDLWEAAAPKLFKGLFERYPNRPFERKELTATLSVCPRLIPVGEPLILNVVHFLDSYTTDEGGRKRPPEAFTWMVFHELMHTWLRRYLKSSELVNGKYAAESDVVKDHLHLMALEIVLFEEAGLKDQQKWIEAFYPIAGGGNYHRAWDLVRKIGPKKILRELD